ncbi:hypothetical protein [Candidatus Phytoplasma palmae]|uniref:hypothetical protein n=1 Tax=Candidatus Phytoplasma palmae TaxID=85624 RepID=UPI003990B687
MGINNFVQGKKEFLILYNFIFKIIFFLILLSINFFSLKVVFGASSSNLDNSKSFQKQDSRLTRSKSSKNFVPEEFQAFCFDDELETKSDCEEEYDENNDYDYWLEKNKKFSKKLSFKINEKNTSEKLKEVKVKNFAQKKQKKLVPLSILD